MNVVSSLERSPAALDQKPTGRPWPWWLWGVANTAVVAALSLAVWYIFADPKWSPFGFYPEPFDAVLLWSILAAVFVAFNLQYHWLNRLPQPGAGIASIVVIFGLGIAIPLVVAYGWGYFDPAFSAHAAAGAGYGAGTAFVLMGFFTYVTVDVNWEHWPWAKLGLKQPWVGIGDIALMTVPTVALFVVLQLPNIETWARPGRDLLGANTVTGWFYCVILGAIMTGTMTDNWPWRLAPGGRGGGGQALASVVGNLAIGTFLYFVFRALVKTVIGPSDVAALHSTVNSFPAQLGVCWSFWMILWQRAFGCKPTRFRPLVNYAVRVVLTFALAFATFLLYYFVVSGSVLHEPVVVGSLHGNALGWMNWMILWTLLYVVGLDSFGLRRWRPSPSPSVTAA